MEKVKGAMTVAMRLISRHHTAQHPNEGVGPVNNGDRSVIHTPDHDLIMSSTEFPAVGSRCCINPIGPLTSGGWRVTAGPKGGGERPYYPPKKNHVARESPAQNDIFFHQHAQVATITRTRVK